MFDLPVELADERDLRKHLTEDHNVTQSFVDAHKFRYLDMYHNGLHYENRSRPEYEHAHHIGHNYYKRM